MRCTSLRSSPLRRTRGVQGLGRGSTKRSASPAFTGGPQTLPLLRDTRRGPPPRGPPLSGGTRRVGTSKASPLDPIQPFGTRGLRRLSPGLVAARGVWGVGSFCTWEGRRVGPHPRRGRGLRSRGWAPVRPGAKRAGATLSPSPLGTGRG